MLNSVRYIFSRKSQVGVGVGVTLGMLSLLGIISRPFDAFVCISL